MTILCIQRISRRNAICCLFIAFNILFLFPSPNLVTKSESSPLSEKEAEKEEFRLCGKEIYPKNFPWRPSSADTPYGIKNWKRDMYSAILLDNRTVWPYMYGQTGNNIQEFFHAFDMARDRGGALVLHENGFPFDTTLSKLYLGLERSDWENLGIMFFANVEKKYRPLMSTIGGKDLYHYISANTNYSSYDAVDHRQFIIQQLYRLTSREMERNPNSKAVADMCSSVHAFFGKDSEQQQMGDLIKEFGAKKNSSQKFTVIHSRNLESNGEQWMKRANEVFGIDTHAGLEYPPDLVTSILAPLGMNNSSILMITDGQNNIAAERLSSNNVTGPLFQVVPTELSTMTGDLMLAILSDVFIGNPISTFSQYIVQVRYAFGIGNSYLFARKDENGKWETFCNEELCFYRWINLWKTLFS